MSESDERLRDARLAQALKHMPDAHMQPGAQVRQALLQEAARALSAAADSADKKRSGAQRRWWQILPGQPGAHLPWNTAFASLALAFFVTVLWYEQEPPETSQQEAGVVRPREAPAPVVASAPTQDKAVAQREPSPIAARPAAPAVASAEQSNKPLAKEAVVANAVSPQTAPVPPAAPAAMAPPAATVTQSPPAAPPPASAPATSMARADAVPEQRGRATLSASSEVVAGAATSSANTFTVTISEGTQQRSVSMQQAQPLLAMLRALVYSAAPSAPARRSESDGDGLVVEIPGQQRWVISGNQVSREKPGDSQRSALAEAASQSELAAVTPAQYAELRRLALEIAARPQ